ncbi:MAG TPA: carboxypeptidase regulatory-like domain-containing protein [Planctomycetota bacterium]|nr:carboxypeptidase regulatory-like domain-containing protein [Planctomycetota bacterium]
MNCGDAKDRLLLLADGDAETLLDAELRAHVDACDGCERELLEMRHVIAAVVRSRESGDPENGAARRDPYSEKVRRDAIAMLRLAAARAREGERGADATTSAQGALDAGASRNGATALEAGPVARPRRRSALAVALAAAAAIAVAWWAFGGVEHTTARAVVVAAADLGAGTRRVRLESGERLQLEIDGVASASAEGPAELDVRLWRDGASLAKDGDGQARAWSVASTIVASDGPVLDVAVIEGAVRVSTPNGAAQAKAGERVFAIAARAAIAVKDERPRTAAAASDPSPAVVATDPERDAVRGERPAEPEAGASATIRGRIEAPADAGELSVGLFDFAEALPGRALAARRTASADAAGAFELSKVEPGAYVVIPNASGAAVSRRIAIVGIGDLARNRLAEAKTVASVGTPATAVEFRYHVIEENGAATVELGMRQAGAIRGTVRDAVGSPVAGASVRVVPAEAQLAFERCAREAILSATDGSFETAGVLGAFEAKAAAADGRAATATGRVDAGETASVALVLEERAAFAGRVEMRDGSPVSGARVVALADDRVAMARLDLAIFTRNAPSAVSGADGTFRFAEALEPRSWVLVADAAGYAPAWSEPLRPGTAGAGAVRLVVARAWSLEGRVVDASGAGIAGAKVTLAPAGRPAELAAFATTDDAGAFRFERLGEGEWTVRARAQGMRPGETRVKAGEGVVEIRLAREARAVRARVRTIPDSFARDARLRGPAQALQLNPAIDFMVASFGEDPRALPATADLLEQGRPATENGGVYEAVVPEGTTSVWLALLVGGRIEDARQIAVGGETELVVDVEAFERSAGALRLIVRDASTGADIPETFVRFAESGGSPLGLVRRDRVRSAYGPLRAGTYDVEVSAPGYRSKAIRNVRVGAGSESELVEVRLERAP